jgi:hypothetical protein
MSKRSERIDKHQAAYYKLRIAKSFGSKMFIPNDINIIWKLTLKSCINNNDDVVESSIQIVFIIFFIIQGR